MLDYIIIIFLAFLIVRGVMRGFIRELSSLIGVILGIWLGNLYQPWMTGLLKPHLPFPQYLPLLSFIFLFFSILIICNLLGWGAKLLFERALEGWFDRGLGALLAVLKGIILTYLVIVMLTFFLPEKTPLVAGSTIAPWIIKSYQKMTGIISPDHYRNWKGKFVGESKKIGDIVSDKFNDMVKKDE